MNAPPEADGITDGRRLAAPGQMVTLADGSDHVIRFTNQAIAGIEEEFGGLLVFSEMLDDGYKGKLINGLIRALAILLPDVGHEALVDLFDMRRRDDYRRKITLAFNEGLPPADAEGKASATARGSRGAGSTTTRSSRSGSRRPSSGK